jgi:hypothetical protein
MAWVRGHRLLMTILVVAVLLVLSWVVQYALFDVGGSVPGSGEGETVP